MWRTVHQGRTVFDARNTLSDCAVETNYRGHQYGSRSGEIFLFRFCRRGARRHIRLHQTETRHRSDCSPETDDPMTSVHTRSRVGGIKRVFFSAIAISLSFCGGAASLLVAKTVAKQSAFSSQYRFLIFENSTPSAWSCDAVITIQVNVEQLSSHLRQEVLHEIQGAVDVINRHARLTFVLDGTTSLIPTKATSQSELITNPNTLLFAFVRQGQSDLLPSLAAAAGGGVWQHDPKQNRPITKVGYVLVDIKKLSDYQPGSGYLSREALFTHELLHSVGLDHVNDPSSLLNTRISQSIGTLGSGDIAGMKELGDLACQ